MRLSLVIVMVVLGVAGEGGRLGRVEGKVLGAGVVEKAVVRYPGVVTAFLVAGVDREFFCPSPKDAARLIAWAANDLSYQAEVYDCDDFALWFKARLAAQWAREGHKAPLAIVQIGGIIVTKDGKTLHHAWNGIVLDSGRLVMVEPQGPQAVTLSQAAGIVVFWAII